MTSPLSPTALDRFLQCPRKEWDQRHAPWRRSRKQHASAGARLGRAAHRTLERLLKEGLYPGGWRNEIGQVWKAELQAEHQEAQAANDRIGHPSRWSGVAAVFVGLRSCLELLEPTLAEADAIRGEWSHTTADGRLVGRPDLLIEGAAGARIIELKTGSYELSRAPAEPPGQLALYAALWRDASGQLPVSVELLRTREGDHVRFPVDPDQVQQAAEALASAHSVLLSSSRPAGTPGDACRSCRSLGDCSEGLAHVTATSEALVRTVEAVECDEEGEPRALRLVPTADASAQGVWLVGLEQLAIPTLEPGDRVAVVGARENPGAHTLAVRAWTNVAVIAEPRAG